MNSNKATPQMTNKDGTPLFTQETLRNEMEFNFKETTWLSLINSLHEKNPQIIEARGKTCTVKQLENGEYIEL